MLFPNIDQNGLGDETSTQKSIADYSAYIMLKNLGYSDDELALQFNISSFIDII